MGVGSYSSMTRLLLVAVDAIIVVSCLCCCLFVVLWTELGSVGSPCAKIIGIACMHVVVGVGAINQMQT